MQEMKEFETIRTNRNRPTLDSIIHQSLKELHYEWTEQGLSDDEIADRFRKIPFDEALDNIANRAEEDIFDYLCSHLSEISGEQRQTGKMFFNHMEQMWGKCFEASEALYVLTVEAAEEYSDYVRDHVDSTKKQVLLYTYQALQHLHGRACQVFWEITYLCRLGFSDGAYARWRSLYEISCTAAFIKSQGEGIAKQFVEQSQTDDKSYDWAKGAKFPSGLLNGKRPGFWSIEKCCELDDLWNKSYDIACFLNHASPQGTFKRMANGGTHNIIPVGQSDYGIDTPAVHAAQCLQWITASFLSIFPYLDGIVNLRVIMRLSEMIRGLYETTSKRAFGQLNSGGTHS